MQELVCGVCGKREQFKDDYDLSTTDWEPYVYDGEVEVSPVCSDHEVVIGDDSIGALIHA